MEAKEIIVDWRDCYIYGERYEVSNTGLVRNKKSMRLLAQQRDRKGYCRTSLSLNNRQVTIKVHRAVAIAFLDNPDELPQVNHKDGNKQNNYITNLEWTTNYDNMQHAKLHGLIRHPENCGRKRISVCKVDLISGKILSAYKSMADAARENGLHSSNIQKVINGDRSSTGGYGWVAEKGGGFMINGEVIVDNFAGPR